MRVSDTRKNRGLSGGGTTISDIARITGFSIKTVSRVINNAPNVKEETRRAILDAIEKHNYSVNWMARGLKTRETRTIILFIDRHGGSFWNAWHSVIIQEILGKFKSRGYKIVISPSSASGIIDDETDGFILLKSGLADGAVLMDTLPGDIRIAYLKQNHIPFVLMGKDPDSAETPSVDLDNYAVGKMAATHLLERGYGPLVSLYGFRGFAVNHVRSKGFREVCEQKGVEHREFFDVVTLSQTYDIVRAYHPIPGHCGFFVSGDEKAVAVMKALREKGLSIPSDVGVLGVDNLDASQYTCPALSSIDQNIPLFSDRIVNTLVENIHSKKTHARTVIIQPRLVPREST
ncbi:MAG TPA: LacI family DNA-binding transcriptional regulator [Thermotogota bacterium]|nr:LacI family DNA-binding transcriptional regulator [Thermotogota bacterium]